MSVVILDKPFIFIHHQANQPQKNDQSKFLKRISSPLPTEVVLAL